MPLAATIIPYSMYHLSILVWIEGKMGKICAVTERWGLTSDVWCHDSTDNRPNNSYLWLQGPSPLKIIHSKNGTPTVRAVLSI